MSILGTLFDISRAVQGFDPVADLEDIFGDEDVSRVSANTSYDSIAKQSKNGVMQFPFLASRSLSFDTMQIVAKAGERNFANFLNVIFSMNQITNSDQPQDFVRRFHQNQSGAVKGPSDVASFIFDSTIPRETQNQIMKDVREGNIVFEEMFELKSLNEMYNPGKTVVSVATEAPNDFRPYQTAKDGNLPKSVFVDSDVKKANEMTPTLMHVRMLRYSGAKGENSKYIDFIVGVKATIHPIESSDMIEHIVGVMQEKGILFKAIRWTTGELSLFKDLIFNIDQVKGEIKGTRTGKSSTWWTALKNAKAKRKAHRYTLREPVLPNASVVMSIEEVDYIKANYGYDILIDEAGAKIINALNILSFYVVDAANEVLYSFIDGDDHFNTNTFKALDRDAGNSERQFKDILKAVNKLQ